MASSLVIHKWNKTKELLISFFSSSRRSNSTNLQLFQLISETWNVFLIIWFHSHLQWTISSQVAANFLPLNFKGALSFGFILSGEVNPRGARGFIIFKGNVWMLWREVCVQMETSGDLKRGEGSVAWHGGQLKTLWPEPLWQDLLCFFLMWGIRAAGTTQSGPDRAIRTRKHFQS